MLKIFSIILICYILTGCANPAGEAPPELLVPVSMQNDTFIVQRGQVAQFEQYRGLVRVASEGLTFADTSLPFGGFLVKAGQEVQQGDVLAVLDTGRIEEQMEERREQISDLQAIHTFQNAQAEREIAIAQIELLSLTRQITESDDLPEMQLLEAADLKRLEISRLQMNLAQARDWQAFSISYYQSDLNEMREQITAAEIRAPFYGTITYIANIRQGIWLESFRPIVFISDGQQIFVEYSGHTMLAIFSTTDSYAVIGENTYKLDRVVLPPNELLFYTRAGANPPFRFTFASEPDASIQPGQFVSLMFYRNIIENAVRIPPNALYIDPEIGHHVYLIENGQRVLQQIEIGMRTSAWIEVVSGLMEGDEILVQQ